MPNSDMVQSVLKALDIVRLVAESGDGLRLDEICTRLSLKKPTAHNLIRTLVARGYLFRGANQRIALGATVDELARLRRRTQFMEQAEQFLRRLSSLYPMAVVTVTELLPNAIQCRLRMSPDRPGEIQHPMDRIYAPYVSPTAICLQATGSHALEYEQMYAFQEYGGGYWGNYDDFQEAKDSVHRSGFAARCDGERLAVAFPVPENYAVGVSLPGGDLTLVETLQKMVKEFRDVLNG